MKKIYKYELSPYVSVLSLPKSAQILCIQTQYDKPCIWALVDPEECDEEIKIEVYATGQEIKGEVGTYIDTFQLYGGSIVFHVFRSL